MNSFQFEIHSADVVCIMWFFLRKRLRCQKYDTFMEHVQIRLVEFAGFVFVPFLIICLKWNIRSKIADSCSSVSLKMTTSPWLLQKALKLVQSIALSLCAFRCMEL
ncbi:uncharacterized protein LOC132625069 [Lycium barbarum]|uniref:uncharacterized protein LOC132625069 n=1 Tax=Lycium barbarum TaxID=112863 RepID=UPI00293E6A01|nr:uncharacterized protein LOC132625069 [Lycium barbarum]